MADKDLDGLSEEVPSDDDREAPQTSVHVEVGKDGLPLSVIQPSDEKPGKVSTEEEEEGGEEEENSEDKLLSVRTRRFATIMNMLNSLLGAGILSVPNTFVNTGIVLSIVLLIIMGVLSLIGTWMVLILAKKTGTKGLAEVAQAIMGKAGAYTLAVLNLLFLVTALIAYLVLGGDMLISWFALGGIDVTTMSKRPILILVYGLCLPIALSIPRNISFLKYFSTATVVCIIFFIIVMCYEAGYYVTKFGVATGVVYAKCDITMFSSLSIYCLTYSLPAVVLPAIRMYNPLTRKRKIASAAAIVLAFIFVAIPGVCGYLCFGKDTNSNIVKNFPDNDIVFIIVRVAFFIIVTCAYPMITQSVMAAWSQCIFQDDNPATLPTKRRIVIMIITHGIPMIISMFLPSAKPALGVSGALGGCLVDFVFPAALWIKQSGKPIRYYQNVLAIIFAVIGGLMAILATYQSVMDAIAAFK